MNKASLIYIAGNSGLVGSAIWQNLESKGYHNLIGLSHKDLNLISQADVDTFFSKHRPEYVIDAAGKVGGILANNTYRAEFIYENLMIQNNIIHAAYKYEVKKLLFLGSSCIYPKLAPQPIREEYLLTGLLEETNEPYALVKIAGIKMCESYFHQYGCNFISVMPTNLYGPNDNYDLEKSHVLPALIRKMHLGKCLGNNNWDAIRHDLNKWPVDGISGKNTNSEILQILSKYGVTTNNNQQSTNIKHDTSVTLWGSGNIYREFLHVYDMADACVHLLENVEAHQLFTLLKQTHINVGTGMDLTIRQVAKIVKEIIGFQGKLLWDKEKPDGTPKKQLDVSLLKTLKWEHNISLNDGIASVYEKYIS